MSVCGCLFHSSDQREVPEFQNLLVSSARGQNWRVARIGICCLKLEPDLFTLALKQVEMSHLATFKLLRSCFETKKIRQSVWWDTILIS